MTLKIISVTETIFSGEVRSVTLPGEMGQFTVLKNHASLLSVLVPGTITYTDANGNSLSSKVSGGIADIDNNVISVCVY
ncbi:MAG: ATP synthase F1 subunit epsilon [Muribaculaceae bacterium]|nr:ATP synthase F1 subunit epsilon [Muribaculaceae bacterium]